MATLNTTTPTLYPRTGLHLVPHAGPVIIHCTRPGCAHRAISPTEGGAVRLLARHLTYEHLTLLARP